MIGTVLLGLGVIWFVVFGGLHSASALPICGLGALAMIPGHRPGEGSPEGLRGMGILAFVCDPPMVLLAVPFLGLGFLLGDHADGGTLRW